MKIARRGKRYQQKKSGWVLIENQFESSFNLPWAIQFVFKKTRPCVEYSQPKTNDLNIFQTEMA